MPEGDIYEQSYDMLYGGQNIVTVFHIVQIGSDGAGDPREKANDMFIAEIEEDYVTRLVDDVASVAVRTRKLFPTQSQAFTTTLSFTGDIADDGMPPNQPGIIRTYGPLAGRKGIGRIMVPGIPEGDVIKGRVNSDQITQRNVFAAKLETDLGDGVTSWVWHYAVLSRIDNVARKIESAGMLTQIKNLRSRTRSN